MQAADSVVAVADDLLARCGADVPRTPCQLRQRHQHAVRQARQLVLPGLPHVDEQRFLAALQIAGKLVDGDLARHGRLLEKVQPRRRLRIVRRTVS